MRVFGRVAAIALLLCIPVCFAYIHEVFELPGILVNFQDGRIVVDSVLDANARALGVRPGDTVERTGLTVGNQIQVLDAPIFRRLAVTVDHGGRRIVVPITAVRRVAFPSWLVVEATVSAIESILGFVLGAIVLWRRPGSIALLYAVYTLYFLHSGQTTMLFSFLPEPAFSVATVAIQLLLNQLPSLALVAFAMRFPRPLEGRRGRTIVRATDAALVALLALAACRTAVVPIFSYTDFWLDTVPSLLPVIAVVAIALVRYTRTRGEDRSRLGWVAAGAFASAISAALFQFSTSTVLPSSHWFYIALEVSSAAMPVALAYAILRHRVLDLGFAFNRTLVYSTITATLVVVVGAIDWVSGKLLGNTHVSAVVEAGVTIALGAALSWFHNRVERGVDRLLFRRRYLAAKRIEGRIEALAFAKKRESVDDALVGEVLAVLQLGSAAVFRGTDESGYVRTASYGWEDCTDGVPAEHLLLRTLQARERPVDLAAAAIADVRFPAGRSRPEVAVPILVRHRLLGFAIYGRRGDESTLDPEEREMLLKLVAAAATAYDAIDADEWRTRALELQRLPALG